MMAITTSSSINVNAPRRGRWLHMVASSRPQGVRLGFLGRRCGRLRPIFRTPARRAGRLFVRQDDGFGEVHPLQPGSRYTLGRAGTNRIVLKDELCSREHAEVYLSDGSWVVRDLGSLNGTRLNNETVTVERPLEPRDEIH